MILILILWSFSLICEQYNMRHLFDWSGPSDNTSEKYSILCQLFENIRESKLYASSTPEEEHSHAKNMRMADLPQVRPVQQLEFSARRSFPRKSFASASFPTQWNFSWAYTTVEIFRRWIFSRLGSFLRNSVYSNATNQVVAHHMY